ncbi:MAG: TetR family transcriptional regulator [Cyclobacteriaceae bacterium]|nr:MAG: TetR family transcriptional regulator [Cyclobacteriaceae bacterium]
MQLVERTSPRKQQIEKQATVLFKSKGYAASSMRDLAQALGIEAASLYSHIRSKQQILHKICFEMAREFFKAIHKIDEITPVLKLQAAIASHFKVITRHPNATAVFFTEWRHLEEPALTEFLALRSQYEQYYIDTIQQGITAGNFKNIDHKLAMMTILSAINWTHQWYRPTGKLSVDEIADQLSQLLINGLGNTSK